MDQDIATIIDYVTTGKFKFPVDMRETPITTEKETVLPVNHKKEFEGIVTDFVTNEFFKNPATMAKFIKLMSTTFTSALHFYKQRSGLNDQDIIFIYKGGNILRLLAYEFMRDFPGDVAELLFKYYSSFFKKSDADFSILIRPTLPNFDKVQEDVTNIAYLLLIIIRIEFLKDPSKYFDFYTDNTETQTATLNSYFDKMKNAEALKDSTNKFYGGSIESVTLGKFSVGNPKNITSSVRSDYLIKMYQPIQTGGFIMARNQNGLVQFGRAQDVMNPETVNTFVPVQGKEYVQNIQLVPIFKSQLLGLDNIKSQEQQIYGDQEQRELYVSVNKTLTFEKVNNIIAFDLVRMKANFVSMLVLNGKEYRVQFGGELIDVSIVKKETSDIADFFEHLSTYVREFTTQDFKFMGTSYQYLIHDLEKILFTVSVFPWDDNKYGKRINRLLFLYLIDLLDSNKKIAVSDVKVFIEEIKDQFKLEDQAQPENIMKHIEFTNYKQLHIGTLLNNYIKMLQTPDIDKEKLKEFAKLIVSNLDIMVNAIDKINQFIANSGKVNTDKAYNIDQFGGGKEKDYYKKYLKYKTKYERLIAKL